MPIDERDYIKEKHPPFCTCTDCTKRRIELYEIEKANVIIQQDKSPKPNTQWYKKFGEYPLTYSIDSNVRRCLNAIS